MSTISLCMISQDEEACIAEGLLDCINYIDEIIILDGGSTDKTKEIVTDLQKVKWYEFPFDFNFGEQKNRCLEKATCEWILFKDCDETYDEDVLKNLQRLTVYEPYIQYDAFAFPRKTYVDELLVNLGGEDGAHDYQIRFWKNGKEIHFEGKIHEGVTGFDNLMKVNAWIIHKKTGEMQQKDNELYWDMGQQTPPGWFKDEDKWIYDPDRKEAYAYVDGIPVDKLDGVAK